MIKPDFFDGYICPIGQNFVVDLLGVWVVGHWCVKIYARFTVVKSLSFFMSQGSFIRFEQTPVFLSTAEGIAPQTGAGVTNLIAANTCEISFEASVEPNKFLGRQVISDDFSTSGPKRSTISVSYMPLVGTNVYSSVQEASLMPFSMTGDFTSGHSVRVGNFLFNQCYLDTLSVQLQAYQPVRSTFQLTSYDTVLLENDVFDGIVNSASPLVDSSSGSYLSCLHALSTNVSGQSVSLPESKTDISVNYQCARSAIYDIGSLTPRTVLLQSVTRSTSVNGENVGRVVSHSGNSAVLNLRFGEFGKLINGVFDPDVDTKLHIGITGRINSQNLSMSPGRSLEGVVNIQESIF